MLGYGCINLSFNSGAFLYIKYQLDVQAGFQFSWIVGPPELPKRTALIQRISDLKSAFSSPEQVLGEAKVSLVLLGLPASPQDAFYSAPQPDDSAEDVSLTLTSQSFSLAVKCDRPFAYSPAGDTFFQNLALTFSQGLEDTSSLSATGTVTAVIFGQEIPLTIALEQPSPDEDAVLVFKAAEALPNIPLSDWGELDITTLKVSPFPAVNGTNGMSQPQVLYLFGEGESDTIYDCATVPAEAAISSGSNSSSNIDLKIESFDPGAVQQSFGNIELSGKNLIASQSPEPGSESSAQKLIAAFQDTSELTISAWIKPESNDQTGPARIVTLSYDQSHRCFTLGQGGISKGQNGDTYTVRLRSSSNDRNGERHVLENVGAIADIPTQTHVVYTLKPLEGGASTHEANLYVDGLSVLEEPQAFTADFPPTAHPWRIEDTRMRLALGNEITQNRLWKGQFYEVAIYSTALSEEVIYRRYYPDLQIAGQLTLTNMPAPLRGPLPASIEFANPLSESAAERRTRLIVESDTVRSLTPHFYFVNVNLQWLATQNGAGVTWELTTGQVEGQLWRRTGITFTAAIDESSGAGQFTLVADAADLTLTPFDGAEPLVLQDLQLVPVPGESAADWQWQMRSATEMDEIELPQRQDGRPFDWAVDFKLLFANATTPPGTVMPLVLQDDRVVLQGLWWGQPLALAGEEDGGYLTLQGTRSLRLPFRTAIGPIYEPGSSHQILPPADIDAVMDVDLTVQLSELGYFATGVSAFTWKDATDTEQTFTLPPFTLTRPPLRPNQILEAALETLHSQVPAIAFQQLRHPQDYYGRVINGVPLIYLGTSEGEIPTVQTVQLPTLTLTGTTLAPVEVGMFKLAIATDAAPGYALTITLPEIDADYAAQLRTDYDSFIAALDRRSGLIPGTITLVKTRLAECLPLPLQSSLYYHYGLRSAASEIAALAPKSVDLQAGMRLRVDFQNYQFVHPALSPASSGFVGSGTQYYSLNSYCDRTSDEAKFFVNFEAFLSQLQPFVNGQIVKHGAASSLDTFNQGYQHPYWRLVYPDQTGDSATALNPEETAQLLGAPKVTDLNNPNGEASELFFRGRATVIPEINIFINGEPTFISVGTTLRQVMERLVSVSPLPLSSDSLLPATGQPRLSRLLHIGSDSQPDYRWVNLTDDPNFFDLPLVKGDRIVVQT